MKKLLNYDFEYGQDILPTLDSNGNVEEFSPQNRYANKENLDLHKYGDGAFCYFSIHSKWKRISGIYAFFIENEDKPVYIGQASKSCFYKRINSGYGKISPRNCYVGGQSTNCKINKVVLDSVKSGKKVSIYFHKTSNYDEVEKELIDHYKPKYNGL